MARHIQISSNAAIGAKNGSMWLARPLLALAALAITPAAGAQTYDFQPRQDGRYIVEATNDRPFTVTGSHAGGTVSLRLEWWGLMGQPVESYSMKWDAEQAKLMRPFASRLPGYGDFSKYPEIVEKAGRIRSTNISARIEFLIRAPKKAVKGRSFFTDCGPVFCTARGIRDLDRGDLPMGPMGQWNTELSPKTPADEMIAVWMGGCTDRLECQRNTLRAGTEMAITKFEIFNLEYNASDARAALKDWAVLAQEDDPKVSYFRTKLEGLTQPREGSETDAEARAAADVIHYSNALNQMVPLKGEAQNLDIAVAATGNEASGDRYYGEWQDALARLNRLHDGAKLSLARARLGEEISPEQVARLKALERDYRREELAVSRADGPIEASGKAALETARAEKLAALKRARGPLAGKADAIDALKREWNVFDEELAYGKRTASLVGSLQRDLALIEAKLTASEREDSGRTENSRLAGDEAEALEQPAPQQQTRFAEGPAPESKSVARATSTTTLLARFEVDMSKRAWIHLQDSYGMGEEDFDRVFCNANRKDAFLRLGGGNEFSKSQGINMGGKVGVFSCPAGRWIIPPDYLLIEEVYAYDGEKAVGRGLLARKLDRIGPGIQCHRKFYAPVEMSLVVFNEEGEGYSFGKFAAIAVAENMERTEASSSAEYRLRSATGQRFRIGAEAHDWASSSEIERCGKSGQQFYRDTMKKYLAEDYFIPDMSGQWGSRIAEFFGWGPNPPPYREKYLGCYQNDCRRFQFAAGTKGR